MEHDTEHAVELINVAAASLSESFEKLSQAFINFSIAHNAMTNRLRELKDQDHTLFTPELKRTPSA